MTQSRYSVLVSLCLLILLTAGFFMASRFVFNKVHTSVEAAIATATGTAVLPPTPTRPRPSPTPKGHGSDAGATDTPSPSAAKVTIGASLDDNSGATVFPSSTGTFYCKVNLPSLSLDTPITFKWQAMPSGTGVFNYTNTYSSPLKYTYLEGPEPPGQYRCQVFAPVNGSLQIMGSASFSVK